MNMPYVLTLTFFLVAPAFCRNSIKFYPDFNFEGDPRSVSLEEPNQCIKVELDAPVKSVRSDFCVLLYPTNDCSGSWIKQLRGNDGASLEKPVTSKDTKNYYQFHSWFPCNRTFDGGPIHVTLDGSAMYLPTGFHDVCECHNWGSDLDDKKFITAGGNCLKIFSEEKCQGTTKNLPYLYNESFPLYINNSNSTQNLEPLIALSFRPCKIPRSCTFISGTIYRIDLLPSLKNQISGYVEQIEIPVLTHNTSEYIEFFGEYKFVDTVQSLSPPGMIGIWRNISFFYSNFLMTSRTGIPVLDGDKWRNYFLGDMSRDDRYAPTVLNVTLNRNLSFTATKPVLKQGYYTASANITIQKLFSVPYIIHMKVTGVWGSNKLMDNYELMKEMPTNVNYVNSSTENEIYVRIDGYVFANFASSIVYNITEVQDA